MATSNSQISQAVAAFPLQNDVVNDHQDSPCPALFLELLLLHQQFVHKLIFVLTEKKPRVPTVLDHLLFKNRVTAGRTNKSDYQVELFLRSLDQRAAAVAFPTSPDSAQQNIDSGQLRH